MTTLALTPSWRPTPVQAGIGFGLLAALIWGSYLALARAGANQGLTAHDIAFLRFAIAGPIMLPFLLRHSPATLAGVGWRRAAVLVLLVGPLFILVGVGGYQFAPLAHGAVFQPAALTLGGMALAALLLGDALTRTRLAGAATIIVGLVLIAGPGLLAGGSSAPLGDVMFVAAGLMWALFTALARRWQIGPMAATAAVSVLSAAIYVPWFLAAETFDRLAALPVGALAAQVIVQGALSGVVAVIAFTKAVALIGAGRAAVFPAIVPPVAILLGVPIAGEIPTALQAFGVAVVIAGLLTAMGLLALAWPAHRASKRSGTASA